MDIILNFAPTGMIPTKDMTPHVPVSLSEIIEDVHAASEIGITSVHLHARDADGSPTYRAEVYREIIEGIQRFSRERELEPIADAVIAQSARRAEHQPA